jgi:acetolactate synthase regulatory subunit
MKKRKKKKKSQKINWQPISALPTITYIIDGMLHDTQNQHKLLLEAQDKPHVLDDYTVDRVIAVYNTQLEDVSMFDEQLSRWKTEALSESQRQEVERLTKQMEKLREVCEEILSLAAELKEGTIDRILGKSDIEVALEVFTGKLKLPHE